MENPSCGGKDGNSVDQRPSEQDMLERQKAFFESFKRTGLFDFEMVNGELVYVPVKPIKIIKLDSFRKGVTFSEFMEGFNEKTNNRKN